MKKFNELYESITCINSVQFDNTASAIIEAAVFFECDGVIEEGMHDLLKKAGLHVKKGDGLIQMIAKAGIQIGKIMIAAYKAVKSKSEADKEALKAEIKKSKVSKGQLMDFLLKLDQATLHLITGPIHMIDAITGWHIGADLHDHIEDVSHKIKSAIEDIKKAAHKMGDSVKSKLEKYLKGIESTLVTT